MEGEQRNATPKCVGVGHALKDSSSNLLNGKEFSPKTRSSVHVKQNMVKSLKISDGKKVDVMKWKNRSVKSHVNQGQKRKHQEHRLDNRSENQKPVAISKSEGEKEKRQKVMTLTSDENTPTRGARKFNSTPSSNLRVKQMTTPGSLTPTRQIVSRKKHGVTDLPGSKSPAWMQHSPRPACCMSPVRKPGTPWRECQLRKLAEQQLAEAQTIQTYPKSGTAVSLNVNISQRDQDKAVAENRPDCPGEPNTSSVLSGDGSAVDGEVLFEVQARRNPDPRPSDDEHSEQSPAQPSPSMSRFRAKLTQSYQKTLEYFREVKNIWNDN